MMMIIQIQSSSPDRHYSGTKALLEVEMKQQPAPDTYETSRQLAWCFKAAA